MSCDVLSWSCRITYRTVLVLDKTVSSLYRYVLDTLKTPKYKNRHIFCFVFGLGGGTNKNDMAFLLCHIVSCLVFLSCCLVVSCLVLSCCVLSCLALRLHLLCCALHLTRRTGAQYSHTVIRPYGHTVIWSYSYVGLDSPYSAASHSRRSAAFK